MKVFSFFLFSLFLFSLGWSQGSPNDKTSSKNLVLKLRLEGAITPSSLELLSDALEQAEKRGAKALIVAMDTPGGLMISMDLMIRKVLASPVPVITYISPSGAACGSAGVFILYSSHLAAMTPVSNIGSATPVQVGGSETEDEKENKSSSQEIPEKAGVDDKVNLKRKLINHAVAQIKSLAENYGRDAVFAEKSITHAENITAKDALKQKVVEIIAESDTDLLKQANGRKVKMSVGYVTLELDNVVIETIETDFRQNFLKLVTNPNIAYILMMIGMLGIIAEIQYPGSVFPGVAGAICLILGLYSMSTLSLSYAGIGLVMVGLVCFVLEVSIISYGLLSIAGIISIVMGSLMLANSGDQIAKLSLSVVLFTSFGMAAILTFISYKAVQALRLKPNSGDDYLKKLVGKAETDINQNSGSIFINGEIWSAHTDGETITKGSSVSVESRTGLNLKVKKI
ncbi:MAG: nodulation protein NfeD [Leptospiraceae bacterium]|nr:nodulation protein NfeD [Leptospiraceae bacterium]